MTLSPTLISPMGFDGAIGKQDQECRLGTTHMVLWQLTGAKRAKEQGRGRYLEATNRRRFTKRGVRRGEICNCSAIGNRIGRLILPVTPSLERRRKPTVRAVGQATNEPMGNNRSSERACSTTAALTHRELQEGEPSWNDLRVLKGFP